MRFLLLSIALLCAARAEVPSIIAAIDDSLVLDVAPTGSMCPAITEDNWILVKRLTWADIRVGDVIVIRLPYTIAVGPYQSDRLCHRVIRKSSGGNCIVTRGDANGSEDPGYWTESSYVGTVVAVVRKPAPLIP